MLIIKNIFNNRIYIFFLIFLFLFLINQESKYILNNNNNNNNNNLYNAYYKKNKTCVLCNDIVKIIDYKINISNMSINIIETVVKDICKLIEIPPQKKECLYILSKLNYIIQCILSGLKPYDICKKIGLCK